jgi:hypothetical protein
MACIYEEWNHFLTNVEWVWQNICQQAIVEIYQKTKVKGSICSTLIFAKKNLTSQVALFTQTLVINFNKLIIYLLLKKTSYYLTTQSMYVIRIYKCCNRISTSILFCQMITFFFYEQSRIRQVNTLY